MTLKHVFPNLHTGLETFLMNNLRKYNNVAFNDIEIRKTITPTRSLVYKVNDFS